MPLSLYRQLSLILSSPYLFSNCVICSFSFSFPVFFLINQVFFIFSLYVHYYFLLPILVSFKELQNILLTYYLKLALYGVQNNTITLQVHLPLPTLSVAIVIYFISTCYKYLRLCHYCCLKKQNILKLSFILSIADHSVLHFFVFTWDQLPLARNISF